jgi:hypothetical protein
VGTIAKSNFLESVQGKACMQTVKKFGKSKLREKLCSLLLLGAELSPDHGYAIHKWLYHIIRLYDKSPMLMGGKLELSTHLMLFPLNIS